MAMAKNNSDREKIRERINRYKKRYYMGALIKGLLIGSGIVLGIFLLITLLESVFHFSSAVRGVLLLSLLGGLGYVIYSYIGKPVLVLLGFRQGMTEEEAATAIGRYFPDVRDRLLNLLQLEREAGEDGSLVRASISQKTDRLRPVEFEKAVDLRTNRKHAKFALAPAALIVIIAIISPRLLPDSSARIIRFNEDFAPEAPFDFTVTNASLQAFKNEDFTFTFSLDGSELPEQSYIIDNERRIKLFPNQNGEYSFVFPKIQRSKNLVLEAAGFTSKIYTIEVVERPDLLGFNVMLEYPAYLGRQNERRANIGNLLIPEGTTLSWSFETQAADAMELKFDEEKVTPEKSSDRVFTYNRTLDETTLY